MAYVLASLERYFLMIGELPFFLNYIIPFLAILTVIVFVHEMGHYLVARWNGVAIDAFSIGFGPELIGWTDKRGTRWRIAAFPLGGYVKFTGDMKAASVPDPDADKYDPAIRANLFSNKSVFQRMAVVVAGPAANFLLTFLILYAMLLGYGRLTLDPVVGDVIADSPAAVAGLESGDRFLSVDGYAIRGFEDVQRIVSTAPERTVSMVVERNGERLNLSLVPRTETTTTRFGRELKVGRMGVTRDVGEDDIVLYRPGPLEAVGMTFEEIAFIIDRTLNFLGDIFIGRADLDQVAGPVGMAQVSGEVATLGLLALVNLTALLSLNIGIINLFPVPMLDGGHLMYYLYEAVRGRPLSQRVQEIGYRIGFALVCTLMVFTLINDLV
ncbi:regulator of sigma E protease [Pelagibacterium halotolerans]|uniref:Zinc metalloprotease n=2 Tax=Pelagibacterium TaxID=1082930 RepID=G4R8U7_PELHB|nr:membrane-associated zinc metalloprotease [Pelagibacterium halotolerans B2]SEA92936.1 regulator of sigma E protease [Pelagibacterium halotolerans]